MTGASWKCQGWVFSFGGLVLLRTTLCAFSGFGKGKIVAQNVGTKRGLIDHIHFGIFCTGCIEWWWRYKNSILILTWASNCNFTYFFVAKMIYPHFFVQIQLTHTFLLQKWFEHTFFVAKTIYTHFSVAKLFMHFFVTKRIYAHFFCHENNLRAFFVA